MSLRPAHGVLALALALAALYLPLLQTPSPTLVAVAQPPPFPLASVSARIDHALFDDAPAVPHAESFALLAIAALLTGLLSRRLGANGWQALFASALIGLHPASIEAVARLSARGDLLALDFSLGALLLVQRPRLPALIGATLCAALALLSSPVALALAPLVLVITLTAPGAPVGLARVAWFLVLTPVGLVVATWSMTDWKPLHAAGVLGRLAVQTAWPRAVVPHLPSPGVLELVLGGLLVAATLVAFLARGPVLLRFALGWLLAASLPVLGLWPLVAPLSSVHALLPLVGLAVAARAFSTSAHAALALVLTLALGAWSFHVERAWEDDVHLGEANVAAFPDLPAAHHAWGLALADVMNGSARTEFETAARLAAEQHDDATLTAAELVLGQLSLAGAPDAAEAHLRRARSTPAGLASPEVAVLLARSLAAQQREVDALTVLEEQWSRTPAPALAKLGDELARRSADEDQQRVWDSRMRSVR
ncbi:MAG: hypothetical protein U0228_23000 [Myxococcaceae bacterium]